MTEQLPYRIQCYPEPPEQGRPVFIEYDFDGSGITETTLTLTWNPPGGPSSVQVSVGEPTAMVVVPDGAEGLEIIDTKLKSARWLGTVSPPT